MANTNHHNKHRQKRQEVAPESAFVEGVLRGLWQFGSWVFKRLAGKGGGSHKQANHEQLRALQDHWYQVELHVVQESTRAMAVSEGDKILDNAMKILGFPGESMADRLRAAEQRFGSDLYQSIWQAHKLRNSLAHEVGATASADEAQRAVAAFRQALYQLGVLQ